MRKPHRNTRHLPLLLAALLSLTLSACGSANADATPTMSVDAIYTAAFQTFTAQQATQLALTPPTPTDTPFPTLAQPTFSTNLTFGTPTTSAGGTALGCDNSVYVADVTIPDKTVMSPGKSFTKTWRVMNNGTCAWSTDYKLAFTDGEAMGGTSVPVPSSVPVGQQVEISVKLTAPANDGDYTGGWRLQNPQGQFFGNRITVVIKVGSGSASTGTPGTPTSTDTPTPTATPTS